MLEPEAVAVNKSTGQAFVNALATRCESVAADVRDVVEGIGSDHRVGVELLRPGPGWGGSCLPQDTGVLLQVAAQAGHDSALLRAAVDANRQVREHVVEMARGACGGSLYDKTVGARGLSFKAGTDDRRSSPASTCARAPTRLAEGRRSTERQEVRGLDFAKVAAPTRGHRIVDARSGRADAHRRCLMARVVVAGGAAPVSSARTLPPASTTCRRAPRRTSCSSGRLCIADVSRAVPVERHADAVFHLASPASSRADSARPLETLAAAREGTRHLLVLASTSFIYGDDGAAVEPVNLGNPDEPSVGDVACMVLGLIGSSAGVEHRPLPAGDPTCRCPDITSARRVLGWAPSTTLGLSRTIEWFRSHLAGPRG